MPLPDIRHCPGTLAAGFSTYSRGCLIRVFGGRKVSHLLPYDSPESGKSVFLSNPTAFSISGVQEKFSVVLEKNKLRLAGMDEAGTHILKPAPSFGKNPEHMPANEHLTMQIARQVFNIETAENALIFFQNGDPAFITRRFDIGDDGTRRAQEDLASLTGKTPQTHGTHFKYHGSYLELFEILRQHLPAYPIEAPKLFRHILFNYLFSNGDAHLKNFSVTETSWGDYRLSPAYDLLNSRIHIADSDFALEDGLLPPNLAKGKVARQFRLLAEHAGISPKITGGIIEKMLTRSKDVQAFIEASYLNDALKRNYFQAYQTRLRKLSKAVG